MKKLSFALLPLLLVLVLVTLAAPRTSRLNAQILDPNESEPLISIGGNTAPPHPSGKPAGEPQAPISELQASAEKGDGEAQYQLARRLLEGVLVEKNEESAAQWLQKAAKQNLPHAQTLLGKLYRDGVGVTRDYFQAIKCFRPAVDQGFLKAYIDLGMLYFEGRGLQRDSIEACALLSLASGVIRLEPDGFYASAAAALTTLEKELNPDQKTEVTGRIKELQDRFTYRNMK